MDNFYLDMWRKSRRFVYYQSQPKGITMQLFLPFTTLESRSLDLRGQIIARIMQLAPGFHTQERLERLADHALLTSLECAIAVLADREINEAFSNGYDAGMAQPKQETSMTQEDFEVLDMELGLLPEVELKRWPYKGGTYTFVCRYGGMNFYTEASVYNSWTCRASKSLI